jgi:hypothetical protein
MCRGTRAANRLRRRGGGGGRTAQCEIGWPVPSPAHNISLASRRRAHQRMQACIRLRALPLLFTFSLCRCVRFRWVGQAGRVGDYKAFFLAIAPAIFAAHQAIGWRQRSPRHCIILHPFQNICRSDFSTYIPCIMYSVCEHNIYLGV